MLDTTFPRILGDAGNAKSYPFPAEIAVVKGAGAQKVVKPGPPSPALRAPFIDAARQLEKHGAIGLVSTCGFLIHFQDEIARAVTIPVVLSALSLHGLITTMTGGRRIGILTASAEGLQGGGLAAAGISPERVCVTGMEDFPAFADAVLLGQAAPRFDPQLIEAEVVARATQLVQEHPEISAILLECANLPPYAAAIRAATGKPVFSIMDAAQMLWNGYARARS